MKHHDTKDTDRIFREERHLVHEAVREGVRQAALRHKALGLPMVVSKTGKVVSVPADEVIAANSPREPRRRRRA